MKAGVQILLLVNSSTVDVTALCAFYMSPYILTQISELSAPYISKAGSLL